MENSTTPAKVRATALRGMAFHNFRRGLLLRSELEAMLLEIKAEEQGR